ncbi:MAG: MlaD family protein [Chromatiales bacterium]
MPNGPSDFDAIPEAVIEGKRRGINVVWLLPIIALLAGAWLVYKTLSEQGPQITIRFATAEGIEEGKTQIKLKDVRVGTVDSLSFSRDLSEVLVSVTMTAGIEDYLTDKTRFWVVRPRIGAGQVSGLGTLISGAYIAMDPDDSGESASEFTGLDKPPVITTDRKGSSYRLKAEKAGSLAVGAPVTFRQIGVGEVTEYHLSDDHESVEIGIFIEAPHDRFVREGSNFWNASGVNLSLDASGINLQLESLVSLLGGGIAFETPSEKTDSPQAQEGHEFVLYTDHAASLEQPITRFITFALTFSDTVRGLEVGAPVEFRGIRIGTVKAIELGSDPDATETLVPVVLIDIEPQRMLAYRTLQGSTEAQQDRERLRLQPLEGIRKQVEQHGLRARLQSGNLLTGKLFVDLAFFPNAPAARLTQNGKYPDIPTMPGSLEGILASVQQLLNKLDKADLEGTLTNLNRLMESTSKFMVVLEKDAPQLFAEVDATLKDARQMLQHASATLQGIDHAVSTDGQIGNQLQQALEEVAAAARSIRVMAEYLERHPEALLKGKGN